VLTLLAWSRPAPAAGPWSWSTFQANAAHTGYLPLTLVPSKFQEIWSVPLGPRPLNPIAAAEGMVFATLDARYYDSEQLFALRAASGEVLWSRWFGAVSSVNPPACAEGNVYVQVGKGSSTGTSPYPMLHAYVGESGAFVHQQIFQAQWDRYYAPTVVDGVVYANGGYYGGLYAFDAFEPLVHWFLQLAQYDQWTPAVDTVYAYAFVGPRLSVVDRATGLELTWITDPGYVWSTWSMNLAPVLGRHDDVVVIQAGRLIAFDVVANNVRFDTGDLDFTGQPAVAHDAIFAIRAGVLSVHDELTGAFLWGWSAGAPLVGTLIVTDRHVLARTETSTHLVDLETRQEVWSTPSSGHLAWSEGVLYLAREDGVLSAWRAPAVVFLDGFESGDPGAWSNTYP
jgi:outer membrane protein assembly factor BamB